MNEEDTELLQLFAEAVARLEQRRLTFTDEEALSSIWEHAYDVALQEDPLARFALVAEADGKHRRQWRLRTQTLANNRLLDALISKTWDGRHLETELARLDAEDSVSYIFCPTDARFTTLPDGTLEPAARERTIALPPSLKADLDALGPSLLQRWQHEGTQPLTVRHITEMLGNMGWPKANERNGWLYVRAWLSAWSQVARVGQDYWLPTEAIPKEPSRRRLQVLPIASSASDTKEGDVSEAERTEGESTRTGIDHSTISPVSSSTSTSSQHQVIQGSSLPVQSVHWTQPLRTVHLLEGFLPVPANARSAYPPRTHEKGQKQVLRGLWFDNGEQMWLWLDRQQDRLYGPDLTKQLEWLEAGDLIRVEWRPDGIVLRLAGHNDEIQREELRLIDPQELKALRGGIGETYRQSLQAILSAFPDGLTFAQLLTALRERQGHTVHQGTVRTLLYAGGFIHRNNRWFAAQQSGARKLRSALVEALVLDEENEPTQEPMVEMERLRRKVGVIRERLGEVIQKLQRGTEI